MKNISAALGTNIFFEKKELTLRFDMQGKISACLPGLISRHKIRQQTSK
jgi:hypothetical protein